MPPSSRSLTGGPSAPSRWKERRRIWVTGDSEALSRVIRNLLENAVAAAGPKGHVRVRVVQTADGATLSVEDDGPGVPGEERGGSSIASSGWHQVARAVAASAFDRATRRPATSGRPHLRRGSSGARFTLRLPVVGQPSPPVLASPSHDHIGAGDGSVLPGGRRPARRLTRRR